MKSIPDTEKVEAAIREANERLRGARVGLTVWRKDNTLYLRGMMPDPKDPTRKKRRNLSTGLKANLRAVRVAEAKAHEAAGDIAYAHTPKFVQEREQLKPIGYYRDTFESAYRKTRGKDFNPDTWRREYANPLAKLPENEVPTAALLIAAIERESERETRKRVRYCNAYAKFARHCGFEIDVKELRKGYDSSGTPRELPSTEVVFEWYERMRGSGRQDCKAWSDALMLQFVFGLRNHEIFHLDLAGFVEGHGLRVLGGKTGDRIAYGLYVEWIDRFDLHQATVPVWGGRGRNEDLGHWVHQRYVRDFKVPFLPYDLRHCYAVRCIQAGIQDAIAARSMGHSVDVHRKTYQRWISERDVGGAFARASQEGVGSGG